MKHKYIETPERMYELFEGYKASLKPREIQKATAAGVKSEWHTPPLTMEGFEVYGYSQEVTLEHYFRNETGSYDAYCTICSRIKKEIRRDQIEGGMVGQFNPSITQRLNSLTEKTENTNTHEIKEIRLIRVNGDEKTL
jgi:hypothetical protein